MSLAEDEIEHMLANEKTKGEEHMMDINLSPTPWKAVKRPGKPSWHIVADDGFILATIHYRQRAGSNGLLPSEAKPNARLIADVPDLLEALKQIIPLVKHVDECDIDFTGVCDCLYDLAMKDARAAIAATEDE